MHPNRTTTNNLAEILANGPLCRHHGIAAPKLKTLLDGAADDLGIDRWAVSNTEQAQLIDVVAGGIALVYGGLPEDA